MSFFFFSPQGLNIHNKIAMSFLSMMIDNPTNKDWIKLLSNELRALEIGDDPLLRKDLKTGFDTILEVTLNSFLLFLTYPYC